MSRSSFRPTVLIPVRPSLHEVSRVRFPRFIGSTAHSDSLPSFPPRFVSFVWRYRRALAFCSTSRRAHRDSAWVFVSRSPNGCRLPETARSPGFPGIPLRSCHVLRPRRIPRRYGLEAARMLSSTNYGVDTPQVLHFGAQCTARSLPVNASQPGSPKHRESLGSGWRPALSGRASSPQGSMQGFEIRAPQPPHPSFAQRTYFGQLAVPSMEKIETTEHPPVLDASQLISSPSLRDAIRAHRYKGFDQPMRRQARGLH